MKIPFRQGILRYQKDSAGNAVFLQKSNGGSSIDLIVMPDPTIVTIAHRTSNYMIEEGKTTQQAWTGFTSGIDYWLYIDLDLLTGARTFNSTKMAPTFGLSAPLNPVVDQHWFDTSSTVMCMKVWNGSTWAEKLRVFVAKYRSGSIIEPIGYGTQIGITASVDAGFVLFDNEGKPLKRFYKRDAGEFFTTSSIFSTQTAKATNISLDAVDMTVAAAEPIPAFSLVSRNSTGGFIRLASQLDPLKPAVGLVQEDFYLGEVGIFTQAGYVHNEQWNWTQAPGTLLFLGANGTITALPPQSHVFQVVGEVATARSIKLNILPPIIYDDNTSGQYQNLVHVQLDKSSGKFIASNPPSSNNAALGYRFTQSTAALTWTITHSKRSNSCICQIFDSSGLMVMAENIDISDINTITVTFATPQAGFANIMFFESTP